MTTTQRRVVVAINPSADYGAAAARGASAVEAISAAGFEAVQVVDVSFESLRAAVQRELSSPTAALVVVGGDGMVSLGANLTAGTGTPLGIIPAGTGNDTARGLGIPVGNTDAAVRMLVAALAGEARTIDAGLITRADGSTLWFVGVFSAGFDAIVNERANRMRWPRGPRRYTLAIVWELLRFRPISYRLEIDGLRSEPRAMLAAVANGTSFGGGMLVAPDALFDDGVLDVFIVTPISKLQFVRLFPRVFTGQHVTSEAVSIRPARRVRIDADSVVAYADGERVGPLPVEIEVVPGALRMLSPVL